MNTGSKVVLSGLILGAAVGLVLWRKGGVRDVRMSGVSARATTLGLGEEPGKNPPGGWKKLPAGIVVQVSKLVGDEWAYVTVPASIADALFDMNQDVSGWVAVADLEQPLLPRS